MGTDSPISIKLLIYCLLTSVIFISIRFSFSFKNKHTIIVFCNVKQGDAVYIRIKNKDDILINTGQDREILSCLSKHMPFFDRKIEYIFLTATSKGTLGGLTSILDRYKIDKIYFAPFLHDTKLTRDIKKQLTINKIHPLELENTQDVNVQDAFFHFQPLGSFKSRMYLVYLTLNSNKIVLLGHLPGRLFISNSMKQLQTVISQTYLLQIPILGFKVDLNSFLTSLADNTLVVITKHTANTTSNDLERVRAYLEAKNINYFIANDREDIVFKLN